MFSTQSDNCIPICPYFGIISLFGAEFEKPKIGISGKGLIQWITLYHIILLNSPETESFGKHCGEKGENAGNQHFLFFPQFFIYHIRDKLLFNSLTHNPDLTTLEKELFENIAGKEENGNQHFLLFPQCFLSYPE